MPGEMQLVEGKIELLKGWERIGSSKYDVEGLQEALYKWVGRTVSITIEDVTE